MRNHPAVVLVAVLLSTLALPVSLTGASVALPDIGRDLDAGLAGVQWVVNGYNATFASFMLATGALADLVGRRRVYAIGVAVFAAGGLLASVAGNIVLLDVARALAGVGAAAAATSASALLAGAFRGRAPKILGRNKTVIYRPGQDSEVRGDHPPKAGRPARITRQRSKRQTAIEPTARDE